MKAFDFFNDEASDAGLRRQKTEADLSQPSTSLLGSPKMQPRDRSNRLLGGVQDGAPRSNRQLRRNKALPWKQIVIAGLVDNPKIAGALGLRSPNSATLWVSSDARSETS